jgi:hypothetical protein
MKTNSLIADERLAASRTYPVVFDQYPRSIVRSNHILSLEAGIFSRDGPLSRWK